MLRKDDNAMRSLKYEQVLIGSAARALAKKSPRFNRFLRAQIHGRPNFRQEAHAIF
jgi:hypothetical protein